MKNEYRRGSKIPTEVYRAVIFTWHMGITASDARDAIQECCGYKLSREAINTNFIEIGNRAYKEFAITTMRADYERSRDHYETFEQYEEDIVQFVFDFVSGKRDIREFTEVNLFASNTHLVALIEKLKERSRLCNGLARETFKSHWGWAWWRLVPEIAKMKPKIGLHIVLVKMIEDDPL